MIHNTPLPTSAKEALYPQVANSFLSEDFLLQTETARRLYHDYAQGLPIIDYHCHLSPEVIAKNENFANMTQIWLAGDHYKWRALRTLGFDERFITGDASDEDKFVKWAEALPYTMRNPLYHWAHMELKNPFGITELLSGRNALEVYGLGNRLLQQPNFTPQGLLEHFKVEMVGTTDDPVDNLAYHQQIAASSLEVKVLPSFRPDKALNLSGGTAYRQYLQQLSEASEITITSIDTLLEALQQRVNFFHENGCRIADHGLSYLPLAGKGAGNLEKVFVAVLNGNDEEATSYQDAFSGFVLLELCKMYSQKGWVQQFHLGALRNTNSRMLQVNGPDTGYDSIGDFPQTETMAAFFNELERTGQLAKTIIYNLNPADNAAFAAMVGNFQSSGVKGKMQFGSAWWFLDQLDGMKAQMDALSNMGLISCFIGMLTDSRSFLSYSRHEYFRRLLCNIFGNDIEQGMLPADLPWVGKLVQDICYYNAKNYFPFH
ncbi:glucuronate isomerase [Pontibacter ummariensis]|uniref:Uronate isomerase n=1 Tax=Pontibacter ummariensis TaxID=1610492 RepID=A0A239DMX2_9BACT|nr:glucuronate isomerase [Pontibacter ummariensis]PRY13856.1 glucuronate isomerase [Pontibacter ummariensis]SNS33471.1 D-glucuronate isomerase [Pontibacter ummariensis]